MSKRKPTARKFEGARRAKLKRMSGWEDVAPRKRRTHAAPWVTLNRTDCTYETGKPVLANGTTSHVAARVRVDLHLHCGFCTCQFRSDTVPGEPLETIDSPFISHTEV
jgi:hypothetical protein